MVLELRRGEQVTSSLTELLAEHAIGNALVAGRGTFDEIELREDGQSRTFSTPSRIVSLNGRARAEDGEASLHLEATVARPTLRGPEFATGELIRAKARELELFITPLAEHRAQAAQSTADTDETAADDPVEPRSPSPRIAAAASPRAASDPWSALAAASAEAAAPPPVIRARPGVIAKKPATTTPSPALPPPAAPVAPRKKQSFDEPFPEVGDFVDHFAFGVCEVISSDGDELVVRDPDTGRTRGIHIGVLTQTGPFEEGGRRVYRLRQRRGPA